MNHHPYCSSFFITDNWKNYFLGVEEQELSEERLRINDRLQEDELLAMESIYGDNTFILERQRGLRSFRIHIHIEVPADLL
ncbi:hypothetical protein OIU74_012676 [Salix koriyanagi]|uniref:Uncharacterized protein n=1 Tax=Salix koriyanagi TaxID=2511006 RepID=A0A9Q0Q7A4_9ROSI|nr:hypothetical protein OIU74_012676 [Salix koriyanagi]